MTNNRQHTNHLASAAASVGQQQQQQANNTAAAGLAMLSSPQNGNNGSVDDAAPGRASPSKAQPQQFLPSTAPVSSLLPPIPPAQAAVLAHHHTQPQQHALMTNHPAALQAAHLAALLTQAGLQQQQQQQQQQHAAKPPQPPAAAVSFQQPPPKNPPPSLHHQLAVRASTATAPAAPSSLLNMQDWPLEQLEQHVKLLQHLNQPIPPNTIMLLNEAKRKAEKKHAKRIANRKSACTSRARKKALVMEMTEVNARLRRQAMILALLPDLVIVIDVQGKITFCSQQVENVLRHSVDDLVGAQLTDIIVPASRGKFQKLIQALLGAENGSTAAETAAEGCKGNGEGKKEPREQQSESKPAAKAKQADYDGALSGETSGDGANAVTDSSFPLSVVQVKPTAPTPASSDSDAGNSKQPSSLTNSSLGNSGSEDSTPKKGDRAATLSKKAPKKKESSSDSSNTSSTESADAKNLLNANANLERNVRWHNMQMKDNAAKQRASFKDDVIGAAVTANNATARLSSLQHLAETSSEEDSGYRESNDSREEFSSSEGENSTDGNGRRKPMAPTCNVCLIRNDLATIWCEVTSSIRTRDADKDANENATTDEAKQGPKKQAPSSNKPIKKREREDSASVQNSDVGTTSDYGEQDKEIFLCLRPIRDGDEKADEALRFNPASRRKDEKRLVSEDSKSALSTSEGTSKEATTESSEAAPTNGSKKRPSSSSQGGSTPKKSRDGIADDVSNEIDNEVVQFLVAMSNQTQ